MQIFWNCTVYENMILGKEKPLLIFYKRVLHDLSSRVTRKIKYMGTGIRRTSEKAKSKQFRLNEDLNYYKTA